MSTEFSKLRHLQETGEQNAQEQFQNQQSGAQPREFATVDELLRHDSEQNPVPPAVGERVSDSLAADPPPKPRRPWYRALFGG